jgi:hypothetical protein
MERLVYVSHARDGLTDAEVQSILATAQKHNSRDGLSGALLKYAGHFVQVLEGDPMSVESAFDRIRNDPRHHDLTLLRREEIDERDFGQWRMRHVRVPNGGDRAVEEFLGEVVERQDAAQVSRLLALLRSLAQRD